LLPKKKASEENGRPKLWRLGDSLAGEKIEAASIVRECNWQHQADTFKGVKYAYEF
jgi:hypothetical protein